MRKAHGFTLIEAAMVFIITAILAAVAVVSFRGWDENRDASMVESTQATIQSMATAASSRMDVAPDTLIGDQRLVNAVLPSAPPGITLTNTLLMTVNSTGRSAQFTITPTGDVQITALNNFPNHTVDANGKIQKS